MTKQEIQAALKAATDKAAKLNAQAERTPEQDAELESAITEAEGHVASLEAAREKEKADAERKARIGAMASLVGQSTPRVSKPSNPANEPSFTSQRLAAEDDPNGGFKSIREVHEAVMKAAVAERMGLQIDERLLPLRSAAGSDEHSTFSDAYGGYLLPEGLVPGLKSIPAEGDPTESRVTRVPMSTQVVNLNAKTDQNHTTSVSGGLRVYRREEAGTVTASRMAMEQIKLESNPQMGVSYASEEILQLSPISFVALLAGGFASEFGSANIREKLRGTGTGQLEGVLNTPCLITVNKETGQSADTILYKNAIKMRSRCWRYSGAVWMYNHDTLPELMNMADDYGRPVWQTSARDGEPDLLLGRPAFPSEYCSTIGDVGDLILGVWSEYLYGELEGQKSAESMHVRFLEHERAFKYWRSNAGKVWWRTAITPAKSTSTLSPFVVLQAR